MILEEPFPVASLPDLYHWLKSCPTIARAAEFPADWESFEPALRDKLMHVRSWAVRDEWGICGAVLLEPVGQMAAQAYVVSARRAWGKGYLDQAVKAIMGMVFTGERPLSYVIGLVKEHNHLARAFNERVGMRLKNVFPDLLAYELTREQWQGDRLAECPESRRAA
jgi:RimJ/RimL family protein N-acetyltransferase